jgi:DNA-binding response OmpR family regulator
VDGAAGEVEASSARGPSTENCGTSPTQAVRTSTFWLPFSNSTSPGPAESSTHQPVAARAGTVVAKRELLTEVWQLPYGGSDKTVDVHLSWLRRKLGESAATPRLLQTVRGVGVRLAEPEP